MSLLLISTHPLIALFSLQIAKRIFKLLGMVRHLQSDDCTSFFKSVVLGMPTMYLTQYQA